MGFEIVLFIALGLLAIAFAIGMLISRNAIHSALFLIGNFGAVAVLFLMLDAPFISMVQIAVYAGAIMVLFLFVIMLLGAEQTADTTPQFRWVSGAATILAVSFLIAFGAPLFLNGVALPGGVGLDPMLRVVHAAQILDEEGTETPVNVFIEGEALDEPLVLQDVEYTDITDFVTLPQPGEYEIIVATADEIIVRDTITLGGNDVTSLVAYGQRNNNGLPFRMLALDQNLEATNINESRVRAVNLYSQEPLVFANVGPDRVLNVGASGDIVDVVYNDGDAIGYGGISASFDLREGTHQLAWFNAADLTNAADPLQRLYDYEALDGTNQLVVLMPDYAAPAGTDGTYRPRILDSAGDELTLATRESFGSPGDIGRELFTVFLLPVNLVGFLLLVALIGVIMLTRPQGVDVTKRRATTNRRRKVSRPLVSVISQQTGRDVIEDTPRLDQPESSD